VREVVVTEPGTGISRKYAAYAVSLLALINIINYLDRNIIFVLFEAIKHELRLSDAELGWLGSAYVIVYALSAIPLGVVSDLKSRRAVVGVGVTVWSAFTALGGLARNFGQLFVCRSMVGVGEASYTPAAQSLIATYFPGRGRALALGVFWSGLALGGVTGIWVGGELEQIYGWRAAFLAVGIPGFVLAMLATQLKDPARARAHLRVLEQLRRLELTIWRIVKVLWPLWAFTAIGGVAALVIDHARFGNPDLDAAVLTGFAGAGLVVMVGIAVRAALIHRHDVPGHHPRVEEFLRAGRAVLRTKTLIWLFLGGALIAFSMNGLVAWSPSYLQRELGLIPQTVGRTIGVWGLAGGLLGTVFGGRLGDHLAERFTAGRVIAGSAGFLMGAPLALWLLTVEDLNVFIPLFFTTIFFFTWYHGPMSAAIFDVVPPQVAASVIGAYVFFTHIAGDAISYPLIGFLSDNFGLRAAMMVLPAAAFLGGMIVLLAARTMASDRDRARRASGAFFVPQGAR
jgi:MFS family permease